MIYIFKMEYRRCLVYKSEVLFSVVSFCHFDFSANGAVEIFIS